MNVERSTADTIERNPVQSLCLVQARQSLTTVSPTAVKKALNTNTRTNCNQCLLDASHTVCAYVGQNTITIGELLYF